MYIYIYIYIYRNYVHNIQWVARAVRQAAIVPNLKIGAKVFGATYSGILRLAQETKSRENYRNKLKSDANSDQQSIDNAPKSLKFQLWG